MKNFTAPGNIGQCLPKPGLEALIPNRPGMLINKADFQGPP